MINNKNIKQNRFGSKIKSMADRKSTLFNEYINYYAY